MASGIEEFRRIFGLAPEADGLDPDETIAADEAAFEDRRKLAEHDMKMDTKESALNNLETAVISNNSWNRDSHTKNMNLKTQSAGDLTNKSRTAWQ